MSPPFMNTIYLALSFLGLFSLAELLYHLFKVKAELTRKFVHLGTGLLTLLFPLCLDDHWLVLFLCSSFAAVLLISLRYGLLKSINAIDRKSHGSISYPIAVYGCYLAYSKYAGGHEYIVFYLPILTLAICDPIAALFGKRWPWRRYKAGNDYKSMTGSAMFFLSACVLSYSLFQFFNFIPRAFMPMWFTSVIIALAATLAEALSRKGLDNIFIPASVFISLYLLDH